MIAAVRHGPDGRPGERRRLVTFRILHVELGRLIEKQANFSQVGFGDVGSKNCKPEPY